MTHIYKPEIIGNHHTAICPTTYQHNQTIGSIRNQNTGQTTENIIDALQIEANFIYQWIPFSLYRLHFTASQHTPLPITIITIINNKHIFRPRNKQGQRFTVLHS